MFKLLSSTAIALSLSTSVQAKEADLVGVYIESLAVIALAIGGHKYSGNMEIKIKGDFKIPDGLKCTDTKYNTTRRIVDRDRAMLQVLSLSLPDRKLILRISDDPNLNAYPNRCSLEAAALFF